MSNIEIAVLATLDSKSDEAHFIADALNRRGASPWVMDLSLKPHDKDWGAVRGEALAREAGKSWQEVGAYSRAD
ncbi:MAG: Tm-1-like ATP-binding domain-containing protein, partial [Alphaproteobacteria bacterium]|nr:Tm-1-like ATP-binding domain-containing protein [Alphaproteobacteria bacterium]